MRKPLRRISAFIPSATLSQCRKVLLSALLVGMSGQSFYAHSATQVGYIGGELDSSNGAAAYSIPIAVPPGVAGMEPILSFNYNSQSGNGLLGLGWNLGGLSVVHRCGSTVAQDGQSRKIELKTTDNYCIDGARLVPVNGANGADGTEYRTEQDGFSKVVSYGTAGDGPAWFKVWTKSGQIMEYGNTDDSRIEAQGKSTVLTWATNKVSDTAGNPINFSYTEITANSEFVPATISYGPQGNAQVRFTYTDITDLPSEKLAGSNIKSTKRLTSVKTYVSDQLVQSWGFDFKDNSNKPDQLTAIELCDANGNCMPKTTFGWQEYKQHAYTDIEPEFVDFNGDGLGDKYSWAANRSNVPGLGEVTTSFVFKVQLATENGFGQESTWIPEIEVFWTQDTSPSLYSLEDIDGDGLTDLYVRTPGAFYSLDYKYLSLGTSFSSYEHLINPDYHGALGDVNGDGRADIIGSRGQVYLANESGSFPTSSNGSLISSQWGGPFHKGLVNNNEPEQGWTAFDINGDSLIDQQFDDGNIYIVEGGGYRRYESYSSFSEVAAKITLLSSITNNTQTTITYRHVADTSVHTNSLAMPGAKDLRGQIFLVSQIGTDDGIGGIRTTDYKYHGGKVHRTGRGHLGFAWTEEIDNATGTRVRTEYLQTFPYTGMPKKVSTWLAGADKASTSDDILISESTTAYADRASQNGKLHFVHVTNSEEKSYEIDGSLVSTVTTANSQFDDWGNLGRVEITTTAGGETYRKITANTYTNDVANHYLGRLTDAVVEHHHADGSQKTRRSSFTYDSTTGFLNSETVEPGTSSALTTTYQYDSYGNKIKVTQSAPGMASRSSTTMFDNNGQFPVAATNALGHSETRVVDPKYGNVISRTGPNGLTTAYTYDGFGNAVRETRADGNTTETQIHWAANCPETVVNAQYCVTTTNAGSAPVTKYYDKLNRPIQTEGVGFDGRKVFTVTEYNNLGQVVRTSRPYYQGDRVIWGSTAYDAMGRTVRNEEPGSDGQPKISTTQYQGLTTVSTNAEGHQKTTRTNAMGKIVEVQEPESASATYKYDALGHLIETRDSAGNTTRITYDLLGRKVAMDDPDMGNWTYTYNGYGELISQTDARGQTTTMEYDVLGRMVKRTEAEGVSQWVYDTASKGLGKLAQVTGPDGYKKSFVYDSLGRLQDATTEADSKVLTISTEYDQYSRIKKLVRPQGFVTENLYTAEGYLEAVRGLRGQVDDYTVQHLETLLETAIRDARELQSAAFTRLQTADRYLAAAADYKAQSNNLTAATLPSLPVPFSAGADYTLYKDAEGNRYIRMEDTRSDSARLVLLHGDVVTPILQPRHYLLKVENNELTVVGTAQNAPATLPGLVATSGKLKVKDSNNDGALEIAVLNELSTEVKADLNAIAAEVSDAAELLLMDVEQLLLASDKLLAIAESAYRQALLAGYWAPDSDTAYYNDYQSLIQDTQHVYFWQAKEQDASGRLTRELHGNGLSTVYNYDPANGLLIQQQTGFANFDKLRDLEYQYDQLNNVTRRADLVGDVEERFSYDALDRLISSTVTSQLQDQSYNKTVSYQYDALGNILYKSDVGHYSYGSGISNGAGPHAVVSAAGKQYQYDANGNMTSGGGRNIQWSSFNKPTEISKGDNTVSFRYAPTRSRYLKTDSNGEKTLYLDKLYELITKGQEVTHKQFIYAGGQLVAIHNSGLDSQGAVKAVQTRYLHRDNLGSIDTITDGAGNVVERMSFDPFGKRRQSNWREANAGISLIPVLTNRGFTGHEHLDSVGLIHMNGRVYDAELGRFLSADPNVQAPYATQNLNRYSYVMNNPLKYTDPSGFFFKKIFKGIKRLVKAITSVHKGIFRALAKVPILNTIVHAAACFYGGPMVCAAYSAASTYAVTGDLGLAIRAGLTSLISAEAASWVGTTFDFHTVPVANVIGNGVVGGVMSTVQGGNFKEGFMASAFAASLKNVNANFWGKGAEFKVHRVITAAVIGGTASVIGGGKFANGAASAAFTQMFNAESTREEEGVKFKAGLEISKGPLKGAVYVDGDGELSAQSGVSALSVDSSGKAGATVGNTNSSYNVLDDIKDFAGDVLRFFRIGVNSDGEITAGGKLESRGLGVKVEAEVTADPYAEIEQSETGQLLINRKQRLDCLIKGGSDC